MAEHPSGQPDGLLEKNHEYSPVISVLSGGCIFSEKMVHNIIFTISGQTPAGGVAESTSRISQYHAIPQREPGGRSRRSGNGVVRVVLSFPSKSTGVPFLGSAPVFYHGLASPSNNVVSDQFA